LDADVPVVAQPASKLTAAASAAMDRRERIENPVTMQLNGTPF
jgi:poly-beta-hydroxyalkanoate depolymerase